MSFDFKALRHNEVWGLSGASGLTEAYHVVYSSLTSSCHFDELPKLSLFGRIRVPFAVVKY
jgi:hypothetical protein